MTDKTSYEIRIEHYEPDNIYPNTTEAVTVACHEVKIERNIEFKSGQYVKHFPDICKAVDEIAAAIKGRYVQKGVWEAMPKVQEVLSSGIRS